MSVWIKIDGDIDGKYSLRFVAQQQEATVLSSANAQQVLHNVNDDHREYMWESVPTSEIDKHVIRGEKKVKKEKKSRK